MTERVPRAQKDLRRYTLGMMTRVRLATQRRGLRGLVESQGHLFPPGGVTGEALGPVLAEGGG